MVRRSPWLDERAALLVRYLRENHGLDVDEDTARHDLSGQLDFTAERMRIGRQAAKPYITDEFVEGFAKHIADAVAAGRAAGAELVDLDVYRRRR